MAQCKKCGNVVAATEVSNGLCIDCLGVQSIRELPNQEESKTKVQSEEKNNNTDTWGIVSLIMGILGFLILPIILGPIGLISGLKSKKSAFGIVGIILSSIQILYVVGSLILASYALNH